MERSQPTTWSVSYTNRCAIIGWVQNVIEQTTLHGTLHHDYTGGEEFNPLL